MSKGLNASLIPVLLSPVSTPITKHTGAINIKLTISCSAVEGLVTQSSWREGGCVCGGGAQLPYDKLVKNDAILASKYIQLIYSKNLVS